MELDDELCLCFHVTKRKVINFLRVEKPRRVGQLSECFGAGTGCGWCRPYLKRLFDAAAAGGGNRRANTVRRPTMPGSGAATSAPAAALPRPGQRRSTMRRENRRPADEVGDDAKPLHCSEWRKSGKNRILP